MTDREIMEQALEALQAAKEAPSKDEIQRAWIVSDLLKRRLAQPEQEPVAWITPSGIEYGPLGRSEPGTIQMCFPLYTAPPQPEPVIDKSAAIRIATALEWEPRREWQGLTVAQIEEAFQQSAGADEDTHIRFARAIEAKLKEKNT